VENLLTVGTTAEPRTGHSSREGTAVLTALGLLLIGDGKPRDGFT